MMEGLQYGKESDKPVERSGESIHILHLAQHIMIAKQQKEKSF